MSTIMTRCSVLQQRAVEPGDLAPDGQVSDDAVRRWVAGATAAYLDQCALLRRTRREGLLALVETVTPSAPGASLGRPAEVFVSASATEVLPASFVIGVRIRGFGGADDALLLVTSVVRLEDPATGVAREIDDAIRDELIALEHAAPHFN